MIVHRDWFSVDVAKRAARVRGRPLAHVLKELLANSLDAGAVNITLTCMPLEGARIDRSGFRAYRVMCVDNGSGCNDPATLRRVGSTTSDDSPTKRGRFGQGLIDVITIAEEADIHTLNHRLVFEKGCQVSSTRSVFKGMHFLANLRHPDGDLDAVQDYFRSMILPEGVSFSFNDKAIPHRATAYKGLYLNLPTPLFDATRSRVHSKINTTWVELLDKFGEHPMVYEMGIPVDTLPWGLPFDVNVGQKTPLDVDRSMLPATYKERLIHLLVKPLSDTYLRHIQENGRVPPEIRDIPENARCLDQEAQAAVVRAVTGASPEKVLRRNPLDTDDRSESQELENLGYTTINRGHLPSGVSVLLEGARTVADAHDQECKVRLVGADLPRETPRQHMCLDVFGELASVLLGRRVYCGRMSGGDVSACWDNGWISFNIRTQHLWENPLGERALGVLVHECAHDKVSGHNTEFMHELQRLGGRLAIWVGQNPERWAQLQCWVEI